MSVLKRISAKYRPAPELMPELQVYMEEVKQAAKAASATFLNQMLIDVIRSDHALHLKIHAAAFLIDEGADVNAPNNPNLTPTAESYRQADGWGLEIHPQNHLIHMSALEWAAELGHTDLVLLLCATKADVNAYNKHAATILLYDKNATGVKALIRAGADLSDSQNMSLLAKLASTEQDDELLTYALNQGELNRDALDNVMFGCKSPASLKLLENYFETYKPEFNIFDIDEILEMDAAPLIELLIRHNPKLIEEQFENMTDSLVAFRSIECLKVVLNHFGHIMDLDELYGNIYMTPMLSHEEFATLSDTITAWIKKTDQLEKRDISISPEGRLCIREKNLFTKEKSQVTLEKLLRQDSYGNTVIDYLAYRDRLHQLLKPDLWKGREDEFETLFLKHIPQRYKNKIPAQAFIDVKAQISISKHLKEHPRKLRHRRP